MKKLLLSLLTGMLCLAVSACGTAETATDAPTIALPKPEVGTTLKWGTWKGAPLEWQILNVEEQRFLVIAKQPVAIRQYFETDSSVTWESSAVRTWLSEQFFTQAFSESEQAVILTTTIGNPDNPTFGSLGGADTADNLFLLSSDEVSRYFSDDAARTIEYVTDETDVLYKLAIAKDSWGYSDQELAELESFLRSVILDKADQTSWWLRSPERDANFAAAVLRDGSLGGWGVNLDAAVRPAMWIKIPVSDEPASTETSDKG